MHSCDIPEILLIFEIDFETGAIIPNQANCVQAEININKVNKTIDELGLNCENRLAVIEELNQDIELLEQNPNEIALVVANWLTHQEDGSLNPFFTTIRYYFGTAAEQFMLS